MAKKRKASGRNAQPNGPQELNVADARLGPITTFEDVADSEDEFFMEREQILLEDEPGSKRRRKAEEDMEMSDEEVLGYEDEDSDNDDEPQKSKASKSALSDEEQGEEGEEGESGWWGSSKKEYYNADNIETEADALEEEVEAKRLQQKKLSKMAEEDFIFDGDEWLADGAGAGEDEETVTEVLKDIEVTDDMGPEERYTLLQTRYPEFDHLVREFETLQPVLVDVKNAAQGKSGKSLEAIKYWVLGCYVAALASYFAILTSPARDSSKAQKTLDPTELRDHDVMQTLMSCREAWQNLRHSKSAKTVNENQSSELHEEELAQLALAETVTKPKKSKKTSKQAKAAAEKKARNLERFKAGEAAVADLYDLPMAGAKPKKQKKPSRVETNDDNSDFGEEDELDARTAADKAARKKSLKFYTSQIVQKSNRRADAGRDAGGDMDLPHRERLRERQARLNAQAERRGKDNKLGVDLGDNSDEEDATTAKAVRDDENEYYDMVAHKSKKNKDDKAARFAAYAAASKADRVVENEVIGEDGKRKITYAIQKNKGLTPKRGKDVRNPRVKKRKQYEAKQKKLKSMKPVWQGGEPKGGYQGELSGINTAVIKSTRL
ncbi:Sas10 C-terminal domain-containing protein [Dactylonectria estremocensis]|uniref:Sas10 C-terminal domain-containing protein n=1 Tax=Dactylonectria estremocensis TaxID=1079267 RepID=A0A9P9FCP5_9HYPO|nr:Sas10 C-terminal domain-containing protein [Dactylonectria estremocensis]